MYFGTNHSISNIGNHWEACNLRDLRLSNRASEIGSKMFEKPNSLIPHQMGDWASTKACYRFLDNPSVKYSSLISPYFSETKKVVMGYDTVLCIHDTSEINYGVSSEIDGLSQVGKGLSKGFLLHTSLAIVPSPFPKVLGLLHQEIHYRKPKPNKETKKLRYSRERESDLWNNALNAIGSSTTSTKYVDIMDRGADIYRVMEDSLSLSHDFIIRAAYNRKIVSEKKKLFELIKDTKPLGTVRLLIRKSSQHKKRIAKLKVASKEIVIQPSYPFQNKRPLKCRVIYAREVKPQKKEGPVEWVILTSLKANSFRENCKVLDLYAIRWIVEEYHKCLKTGCRLEERQLKDNKRIERLMDFLSVVALRLLQIKEQVKSGQHLFSKDYIDGVTLEVLERKTLKDTDSMTLKDFWIEVAKIGGFLGRKNDGDP